ncbi:MAG: AbrB/MazE/SpoVT family DNA-binding domain-containing protein [Clostridia bacterium]|nr:AbrB/MazE/SpoVT family DNA-binding domain-containing protein [Clostridia bacterium]
MNGTITRRIDELGRIVIPKELRRTLRIKEGDELEILPQGENLVLRK